MRKAAFLKEPLKREDGTSVYKIMLYLAEDGCYLFEYFSPDAVLCSSDCFYDSLEDLLDEWDSLIDQRGWIELEDPLPDCQHDAWIPVRVKGRDAGKPEWGKFETIRNGKWVDFRSG